MDKARKNVFGIAAIFLISDFIAALLVKVFDPRLRAPETEVVNT